MFRIIIAIIVLGIIFTVGLDVLGEKAGFNKKSALISLQSHIQKKEIYNVDAISCKDADHDGDSLIPCTIVTKSGEEILLECDGWHVLGSLTDDQTKECEDMNEVKVLE